MAEWKKFYKPETSPNEVNSNEVSREWEYPEDHNPMNEEPLNLVNQTLPTAEELMAEWKKFYKPETSPNEVNSNSYRDWETIGRAHV